MYLTTCPPQTLPGTKRSEWISPHTHTSPINKLPHSQKRIRKKREREESYEFIHCNNVFAILIKIFWSQTEAHCIQVWEAFSPGSNVLCSVGQVLGPDSTCNGVKCHGTPLSRLSPTGAVGKRVGTVRCMPSQRKPNTAWDRKGKRSAASGQKTRSLRSQLTRCYIILFSVKGSDWLGPGLGEWGSVEVFYFTSSVCNLSMLNSWALWFLDKIADRSNENFHWR